MKRFSIIFILIFLSPIVQAQDGENNVSTIENISYGYADVLRVDPVYEYWVTREPREECYGTFNQDIERPRPGSDTTGGAVTGAARGGDTGREVNQENNAAGQLKSNKPNQHCQIVEAERKNRRIVAYDVEYRYRGEVFLSRLNNDPGDHLRIRITITPEE